MLQIQYKNKFKKDINLAKKRGKDIQKLKEVITLLIEEKPLPLQYKDHPLIGNYVGRRECHIEPNWLLIYKKTIDMLILERTGTHADLFQ